MSKIAVYIHTYTENRWEVILSNCISAIVHSGLYADVDRIFVCVNGSWQQKKFELIQANYTKVHFVFNSAENNYEWDTLQALWIGRENYDYVLYLHTKGSSFPEAKHGDLIGRIRWLNFMLFWNVANWRKQLAELKAGTDTCGSTFMGIRNGFWVGNFWWASANWIKQLPEPLQYRKDTQNKNRTIFDKKFMASQPREHINANRWGCEMWVTDKPIKKIFDIHAGDPQKFNEWNKII